MIRKFKHRKYKKKKPGKIATLDNSTTLQTVNDSNEFPNLNHVYPALEVEKRNPYESTLNGTRRSTKPPAQQKILKYRQAVTSESKISKKSKLVGVNPKLASAEKISHKNMGGLDNVSSTNDVAKKFEFHPYEQNAQSASLCNSNYIQRDQMINRKSTLRYTNDETGFLHDVQKLIKARSLNKYS